MDSGQPWGVTNAAVLTEPVANAVDLQSRAAAAIDQFRVGGNPWFLTGSQEWLGPDADHVLTSLGLVHAEGEDLTGMVVDRLLPPARPLPKAEVRRFADEATRAALADLNATVYEVPLEWVRLAIGHERYWQGALLGHVAYLDSQAVAGDLVLPIDNALYVGWVATAREYRRRGLAELVMRHSLDEARRSTGLQRTILHSSLMAVPVYERMGYRSVCTFQWWEGPF